MVADLCRRGRPPNRPRVGRGGGRRVRPCEPALRARRVGPRGRPGGRGGHALRLVRRQPGTPRPDRDVRVDRFLGPVVGRDDLSALPHLPAHRPKQLSSLEFPHRNADAYLRDAQLDGQDFFKTALACRAESEFAVSLAMSG